MNMIRNAYVLVALLILFASCKNSEKETPSGLKFKVVKEGNGVLPKKDQIVVFNYVMKDSKDSIWNDTYDRALPGVMRIADSAQIKNEDGMKQMFRMLSQGDSATVVMPVSKFFKEVMQQPLFPGIDSTLTISWLIKVDTIMSMQEFQNYQVVLMENKRKQQHQKDEKIITKYLADKNISQAKRDSSGIHYVIHTEKGGQKPDPDKCVSVNYKGSLMEDGRVFDQQNEVSFPLMGVIQGWRVGIPLLGIGDSATLYIPSNMAYGAQGVQGAIPPDAVLVFDVKLLAIKEFDPKTRSCK